MSLERPHPHLIGGEFVLGSQLRTVTSPSTEQPIARFHAAELPLLDRAARAARAASGAWSVSSIEDRRSQLAVLSLALREATPDLARTIASEHGKPITKARLEIALTSTWLEQIAAIEAPMNGEQSSNGVTTTWQLEPRGVTAVIAPWNFPIKIALAKAGLNLLAGNTVIVKPSPRTPLSLLHVGQIARDVFPAGVLNIVAGDDELGRGMVEHEEVDVVSFTGSTANGLKVANAAARRPVRAILELGGNDAAIVLDDASVESIEEAIFWSAFANAGQSCTAIKRLLVHEDIAEVLVGRMVETATKLRIGPSLGESTEFGPVNSEEQLNRLLGMIAGAEAGGGVVRCGGARLRRLGFFLPPTIIMNPPHDCELVREEQFGPVLPVLTFKSPEEAIRLANDTHYGLGGSVWSADTQRAIAWSRELKCCVRWINAHGMLNPSLALEGWGHSGSGYEYGALGLAELCRVSQTVVRAIGA